MATSATRAVRLGHLAVTNVDRISIPLLVSTGGNDPRVPTSEADQVVKASATTAARPGICWPSIR